MQHLEETAALVLDTIRSGRPVEPVVRDAILSAVVTGVSDDQIETLVGTLQPAIRGCDWPAYLIRERLPLDGLTESEREDLDAGRHSSPKLFATGEATDPASREWEERVAGHKRCAGNESPLVERLEVLAGADTRAVEQIAEAVGETTGAFLTLPPCPPDQLPVLLPARLLLELPPAVPVTDHETTKFLHDLLKSLGVRGRRLPPVVALCGRELHILFPTEADAQSGTYAFRQARLLIEDRVAAAPADVEAVAWLAELNLRADDAQAGEALARRLWALTAGHDPTALARIVQFSLGHDWNYSEPSLDGRSWDAGRLGRLEAEWLDREEPLAHALLRRAFAGDRWNADLVQTVHELCFGSERHELPDDLMPSAGWVWAAHAEGGAGYDYYRAWGRAFAAAVVRQERDIVILAVPHLIAGALSGRCDPAYHEWLSALLSLATTPGERRSAAQVVTALINVSIANILSPPARVILDRLAREFAAEMVPPAEDSEPNTSAAELSALSSGLKDIAAQEGPAREYLGDRLWDCLSPQTRCHIKQTLGVFHYFELNEGDSLRYGIIFVELANSFLSEVEQQFSMALALPKPTTVFNDPCILYALGQKKNIKSIGSLPHLFELLENPPPDLVRIRDYAAVLRRAGIRVDTLVGFRTVINELAGVRNAGAHAGGDVHRDKTDHCEKVDDRERAKVLFGKWFRKDKGLLREFLKAIHPAE